MVRYHLNPETGNPGICRADPSNPNSRGCRFNRTDAEHYPTREAARAAFEESQAADLLSPSSTSTESRRDAKGWLKPEFAAQIKPQGVECPHCGKAADYMDASTLIDDGVVECSCGGEYDTDTVVLKITPGHPSYEFSVDKESVKKATWYHATDLDDWAESLQHADFEAHVGTESAAFDRAMTNYVPHLPWTAEQFYLYEVEIDESASVDDEVARDENSALINEDREGADVFRYFNLWEDMASISLAARSSKLKVVRKRTVTRDEAHERLSLYNVFGKRQEEEEGYAE